MLARSTRAAVALLVMAATSSVVGCDDRCRDAIDLICERACGCNACGFIGHSPDGEVLSSSADEPSCKERNAAVCDEPPADANYETCIADLEEATCTEGGFPTPESCVFDFDAVK